MKKIFSVLISLFVGTVLITGCDDQPEEEVISPEETTVSSIPETGDYVFPDNVRELTEEEKQSLIEIALDTPFGKEWLEKEPVYSSRICWIGLFSDDSGNYTGYSIYDYEVVEYGIPKYMLKNQVSGAEDADVFPNVVIHFGDPSRWTISVAIDLEIEEVKYIDSYVAR